MKRKVLKAFIKMQRADVVCLQETKWKEVSNRMIRSLGVGRFLEWAAIKAEGASGGHSHLQGYLGDSVTGKGGRLVYFIL